MSTGSPRRRCPLALERPNPADHPRRVLRALRRAGIAIGSVVMAWLAVSITGLAGPIAVVVVLVLGGLIYQDILRRERPRA
jgi:hypothetical protein